MLMSIIADMCVHNIFETGRQSLSMLSVLDSNPKTQLRLLSLSLLQRSWDHRPVPPSRLAMYVCMYMCIYGLVVVGIESQTTAQLSILPLRHIPCLCFVCLLRQTLV